MSVLTEAREEAVAKLRKRAESRVEELRKVVKEEKRKEVERVDGMVRAVPIAGGMSLMLWFLIALYYKFV